MTIVPLAIEPPASEAPDVGWGRVVPGVRVDNPVVTVDASEGNLGPGFWTISWYRLPGSVGLE